MNDRPFDAYTFIYHFPRGPAGGGMEHAFSTAIDLNADQVKQSLDGLTSVTAHEFFHLWNVKRIRPQTLEPIDYTKENVAEKVKAITKGKGVPVVFDGVGKDTWEASLDSLQPRGLLASFGNASGPVAPVPPGVLNTKGSLYLTRPSLGAYTATRKDLEASAKSLFKMVKSGKVKIAIDQRYPLAEAGQAHIDLEGRKTTGQTVLVP